MFNSQILDVLVGVVFIYCLVSVICTAVKEGLESLLKTRASYLEYGIRELLHDTDGKGLAKDFFQHPLIFSLFSGEYTPGKLKKPGVFTKGHDWPSYIPAANFAKALLDLAAHGPDAKAAALPGNGRIADLNVIRANVIRLNNRAVQRVLLSAIDNAQGNLDQAQQNLEQWYDSSMDRVSGWYTRSTRKMIFCISLTVTIALNINTLTLVHYLYVNDTARAMIAAEARNASATNITYDSAKTRLEGFALPIGWSDESVAALKNRTPNDKKSNFAIAYELIFGWLMTAFAGTLGAPFWFDMLNKVVAIRSTTKPKDKSTQETAADQQQPASSALAMSVSPSNAQFVQAASTQARATQSNNAIDADSHLDGCDGNHAGAETPDNELPHAQGGVAS